MKRKTSIHTTLITTGTVLTSLPVFAHSDHFEKTETKTKTKTEEKSLNNQPDQSTSSETQTQTTDSQEEQPTTQTQPTNSQEEQPTTQTQTITITKIPTVGETLLGLIIVAPFLLYAFKKRIHRYG